MEGKVKKGMHAEGESLQGQLTGIMVQQLLLDPLGQLDRKCVAPSPPLLLQVPEHDKQLYEVQRASC